MWKKERQAAMALMYLSEDTPMFSHPVNPPGCHSDPGGHVEDHIKLIKNKSEEKIITAHLFVSSICVNKCVNHLALK